MIGASPFPRHWVYDAGGSLSHKSGLTDFSDWYRRSFGRHSPWGDEDSAALVTAVETALERELSVAAHARRGQAADTAAAGGRRAGRARGSPGPMSTCVLDGVSGSNTTGSGWPSTGRAPCWGSVPTWRAAPGPRRWWRSPPAGSRSVDAGQLDRSALQELAGGHRAEDRAQVRSQAVERVRLYLCGVAARRRRPGAEFLRYGGHTSCVALAPRRRRRADAASWTPAPACAGSRALLGGQPFDGTILLTHLHWDHVHGLPFFTGGDREGRGSACCCPSRRTARAPRRRWPRACRRRTSRSGRASCAARGPSARVAPGPLKAEGFTIEARDDTAQGRRDVRLPGQRRRPA